MEPAILPVKPGTISAEDKAALREIGVLVIEHEHPSEIRILRPFSEIEGGDLLLAAMRGVMAEDGKARYAFSKAVLETLEKKAAEHGG
jgi:hypothetical protein